jgi:hypothetical protein
MINFRAVNKNQVSISDRHNFEIKISSTKNKRGLRDFRKSWEVL